MTLPGGERPGRWPVAYLITFSCYGARIHGEDRATVDKRHNAYGAPFAAEHAGRVFVESRAMAESAYRLDRRARAAVLSAIREVTTFREWKLCAVHVRVNHVHVVVGLQEEPSSALRDFKAYAGRALKTLDGSTVRSRRWARHGSVRWLWSEDAVAAAVEYVLFGQGTTLDVWPSQDP